MNAQSQSPQNAPNPMALLGQLFGNLQRTPTSAPGPQNNIPQTAAQSPGNVLLTQTANAVNQAMSSNAPANQSVNSVVGNIARNISDPNAPDDQAGILNFIYWKLN